MLEDAIEIPLRTNAEAHLDVPHQNDGSDAALVAAVLVGDEKAFAEIFEKYRRTVARTIGKFFRDRNDIEELMQQAFTKAYFSLKGFKGNDDRSLGAWLSRIAINICYDEFRLRRRNASAEVSDLENEDDNDLDRLMAKGSGSAESSLIHRELAERILASLQAEDRVALTLVYSEEYSLNEAADVLGITTSSLKSRLFRCRSEIKRRFGYLFS